MSLDGSNDMVLLPPRDDDNGGRQPARRRRNRRRLPHVAEEQHTVLSRRLPRRRRRRRGRHGQAGGDTSSAVERDDGTGAPAGDTPSIDLVSETKTSVVSPQHSNIELTDDASTLAKGLLGVALVPETTVQSALTRLRHHLSIKRYRPFPIPCLSDSASIRQATPLRWRLSQRHVQTLRGTMCGHPGTD
jgi:hypothetical protein